MCLVLCLFQHYFIEIKSGLQEFFVKNKTTYHTYDHGHSVLGEIICHFPYAVFSVAFSLIILSFTSWISLGSIQVMQVKKGAHMLFHAFHFMHIVFAATGATLTFFRFSNNVVKGIIVSALTTTVFCTLSDSILPYIGGKILGVNMHLHLCFLTELQNVLPFLFIGLVNGYVLSRHHSLEQTRYSVSSHFVHIFISSLASSFFLIANGLTDWYHSMGMVFLFLIIAVVVPCTLSDVVIPMSFAVTGKKSAKH